MITLDKILIVSPIESVTILNEDEFSITVKKGERTVLFEQKIPFKLSVKLNYTKKESVLEFTGKILLDDYVHLINKENIRTCLSNINALGICSLDVDLIMREGRVYQIDVTKDIPIDNCKDISEYLRGHISNYHRHNAQCYQGNLEIKKGKGGAKRRLVFYDKELELTMAKNRTFLNALTDATTLLDYFQGKARFELNLNSASAIKKDLKIKDTNIMSVLESTENPIVAFIDEVIVDDSTEPKCSSAKERLNLALLKECDMDIRKVYEELKPLYSPKTHMTQVIQPFQHLLTKLNGKSGRKYKQTIMNLLSQD